MSLIPAAIPAKTDHAARAVRFAMKNGARLVTVLVSDAALKAVEPIARHSRDPFEIFKPHRKDFERVARHKHDLGHVESDGSIHICARDMG